MSLSEKSVQLGIIELVIHTSCLCKLSFRVKTLEIIWASFVAQVTRDITPKTKPLKF